MTEFVFNPSPQTSENMRKIRGKNTNPEMVVRKACRDAGFPGYRLHRKDLPGKPDIVYVGRKMAIFVNGCFWHGHDCPVGVRKPKTNQAYWIPKIDRNKERDARSIEELVKAGWRVLIVWECETKNLPSLARNIAYFLAET